MQHGSMLRTRAHDLSIGGLTHSLAVEGGKEYPITNLALPESVGFSLMSLSWVKASMAPLICAFGHDFLKLFFLG